MAAGPPAPGAEPAGLVHGAAWPPMLAAPHLPPTAPKWTMTDVQQLMGEDDPPPADLVRGSRPPRAAPPPPRFSLPPWPPIPRRAAAIPRPCRLPC